MSQVYEITIPKASSSHAESYTLYEIHLRLPLRSYVIEKRFSDFVRLDDLLTKQAGSRPPLRIPPKTFFSSTTRNAALKESRRQALEKYLQTINEDPDSRWRKSNVWNAFLALPSRSKEGSNLTRDSAGGNNVAVIVDPLAWLDIYGDLQKLLRETRLRLAATGDGDRAASRNEEIASARKSITKTSTMIGVLDRSLTSNHDEWSREKLGEGETRRRKDLILDAVTGKEELERLIDASLKKADPRGYPEGPESSMASHITNETHPNLASKGGLGTGRILGKETQQTKELDNKGVLKLQQQMMKDQDEDLTILEDIVRRQKVLAIQVNEELVEQNEMLKMLDDDVTRTGLKVELAKKKLDKIR